MVRFPQLQMEIFEDIVKWMLHFIEQFKFLVHELREFDKGQLKLN